MASGQGGPSTSNTGNLLGAGVLGTSPSTPPRHCRWRSSRYHDQECHRFFDCPSHLAARNLSAEAHDLEQDQAVRPSVDELGGFDGPAGDRTPTTNHGQPCPDCSSTSASSRPLPRIAIRMDASNSSNSSSSSSNNNINVSNNGAGLARFYPTPPVRSSSISHHILPLQQQRRVIYGESSNSSDGSLWSLSSSSGHHASMGSAPDSRRSSSEGLNLRQALEMSLDEAMRAGRGSPRRHAGSGPEGDSIEPAEVFLPPRWQPDAEVTYCPICQAQFSIFVRKHHCRKCGRVVCNSCSPHRIIIPHQFIVRPPGSDVPLPQSLLLDGLNGGFLGVDGLSGGERVRLCNPCVPDPNTAPPQNPSSPSPLSPRSARQRSRSSFGPPFIGAPPAYVPSAGRYGGSAMVAGQGADPYQAAVTRRIVMDAAATQRAVPSARRRTSAGYQDHFLSAGPSSLSQGLFQHAGDSGGSGSGSGSYGRRRLITEASSSRQRALPPRPPLAEEDECPICHLELPSRSLTGYESLREMHITECIQSHSAYGSPRPGVTGSVPPAAPRRTGMYTYAATEKDCIDDAECTICLEEFAVGVAMARLECLCRFHRSCISAWFVNHPGRCPVHQHDGFGY